VRSLGLTSRTAFDVWWSKNKPQDIRCHPDRVYASKGWAGWGDCTGTGNRRDVKWLSCAPTTCVVSATQVVALHFLCERSRPCTLAQVQQHEGIRGLEREAEQYPVSSRAYLWREELGECARLAREPKTEKSGADVESKHNGLEL